MKWDSAWDLGPKVAQFDNSKAMASSRIVWHSHTESWIKINFDGSSIMHSTAVEGFFYNCMGRMVVAYTGN